MASDTIRVAEAAELALVELCKSSSFMTGKAKIDLLTALEHSEARDEQMLSMIHNMEKTVELAASDAGERVKYIAACRSMKKRWEVFESVGGLRSAHFNMIIYYY